MSNSHGLLSGLFGRLEKLKIPISVADKDRSDCGLVFVNDAFEKLTGYGRGEVLGKNCRFLQGTSTNQKAVESIKVAVEGNRRLSVCILNYRKNGSPFHNLLMLAPIDVGDRAKLVLGCQYEFSTALNSAKITEQINNFNGILSYFPVHNSDGLAYWQHYRNTTDSVRMIVDSYCRMHKTA